MASKPVSGKDGTRDDDQEGTIKQEAERGAHRGERGITPERWAESERANADSGELTRAGRHAQQPTGREGTAALRGEEEAEEAMDRRVEEQAEVGRRAAESGDGSPRRLE
ncbi:hypothetical protein FGE12_15970 [Aggregicoccus sp. 17bor-14]|uniref:hypothetical protein n=1 Tax=Myxococcaceae TaxID=31 RepID=UPI00129CA6CA|nr:MULTISPECIES: hypothetical protein [Myxococcaceae]MBF5043898.1 hypothetical protein [Simulacricoccus sp. 17bor-14]MRI89649.1 hypothetical protein [Aggregicoccus sp. 17bor-14]